MSKSHTLKYFNTNLKEPYYFVLLWGSLDVLKFYFYSFPNETHETFQSPSNKAMTIKPRTWLDANEIIMQC